LPSFSILNYQFSIPLLLPAKTHPKIVTALSIEGADMKKTIFAISFLLISFVAASSQTAQWSGYYSQNLQFLVSFPGDPKLFTESLDEPQRKRYTYLVGGEDLAYMVMVSDLHATTKDSAGHVARVVGFDINDPRFLEGLPDARLISQKSLVIDGIPGRELVELKDGLYIRIRLTYNLGRVYEVGASVKESLASDPETQAGITRFLDSFHFKSLDLSGMPYQEGL
jgi:hypothetical protein